MAAEQRRKVPPTSSPVEKTLRKPVKPTADAIEQMLDDIDDVLEENAEEFVKNYIQRGGNGEGPEIALLEMIAEQHGAELVQRLLRFVAKRRDLDREDLFRAIEQEFGADIAATPQVCMTQRS